MDQFPVIKTDSSRTID